MSEGSSRETSGAPRGLLLAMACSGAAGLVDEVAWLQLAGAAFGSTTRALSVTLAVFFLGLALGGAVFGRRSRTSERPTRDLALLLLVLAGATALSPLLLVAGQLLFGLLAGGLGLDLGRALAVGLALLPATFCMGGSLPLAARLYVDARDRSGQRLGVLYAANTAGALVGAAAAGFALLPTLGAHACLGLGAALDAGVGLWLWRQAERSRRPLPLDESAPTSTPLALLACVSCLGFAALAAEVIWARLLALLLHDSLQASTWVLCATLAGLVLGGLLAAALADLPQRRERSLAYLAWLLALLLIAPCALRIELLLSLGDWLPLALFLPAATLSGALLPLAVRAASPTEREAGARLGALFAANTGGGVLGALLAGFVLLPALGIDHAARVAACAAFVAGLCTWLPGPRASKLGALAPLTALALFLLLPVRGRSLAAEAIAGEGALLELVEGREASVAVVRRQDGTRVLLLDGWWQGQDVPTHQRLAAHLPLLLHPDPKRALVIGVGAGQTPARALLHESVLELACVDAEPLVFELIQRHFEADWLDDPRVQVAAVDGRGFLRQGGEPYDVIAVEVGQPARVGVAGFYTVDFYEELAARLAPDGIATQFVPLPFLDERSFAGVLRSFAQVFPSCSLWYNTSELLLVGARAGELALDTEALDALAPAVRADLDYSPYAGALHWLSDPDVFLGGLLCGADGVRALAEGGALYRDARPRLAREVNLADEREPSELPLVALLREAVEPAAQALGLELGEQRVARIAAQQARNLDALEADALLRGASALYQEQRWAQSARALRRVLERQPLHVPARCLLGEVLRSSGRAVLARVEYEALLDTADGQELVYAQRGLGLIALGQEGDPLRAEAHFRAALELDPLDAELHKILGAALGGQGRVSEAIVCFERALELAPGDAGVLHNLEIARAQLASGL